MAKALRTKVRTAPVVDRCRRSPSFSSTSRPTSDSPAPPMSMRWVGPQSVTSWPNSRCHTSSRGKPSSAYMPAPASSRPPTGACQPSVTRTEAGPGLHADRQADREDAAGEDAEQAEQDEVVRRVRERPGVAPLADVQADVPVHAEQRRQQADRREQRRQGDPAGLAQCLGPWQSAARCTSVVRPERCRYTTSISVPARAAPRALAIATSPRAAPPAGASPCGAAARTGSSRRSWTDHDIVRWHMQECHPSPSSSVAGLAAGGALHQHQREHDRHRQAERQRLRDAAPVREQHDGRGPRAGAAQTAASAPAARTSPTTSPPPSTGSTARSAERGHVVPERAQPGHEHGGAGPGGAVLDLERDRPAVRQRHRVDALGAVLGQQPGPAAAR